MTVTSKDGHFYYKSNPQDEVPLGMTCGLYLITDPERQVEIEITHIDVSCDAGGLISVRPRFYLSVKNFFVKNYSIRLSTVGS